MGEQLPKGVPTRRPPPGSVHLWQGLSLVFSDLGFLSREKERGGQGDRQAGGGPWPGGAGPWEGARAQSRAPRPQGSGRRARPGRLHAGGWEAGVTGGPPRVRAGLQPPAFPPAVSGRRGSLGPSEQSLPNAAAAGRAAAALWTACETSRTTPPGRHAFLWVERSGCTTSSDLLQEPPPQAPGSHCPTTGGPRASEHGDGSCHTAWEMPRAFVLWLVPAQPPGQGAVVGRDRTQTQRGRVLAPRSPRGGFAVRFQGWSGLGW